MYLLHLNRGLFICFLLLPGGGGGGGGAESGRL